MPSNLWRMLLICQVWAFVLFLPTNAELTTGHNRYFMAWHVGKLPLFLGATCLLGLALFVSGLILRLVLPHRWKTIAAWAAILSLAQLVWALLILWSFNNFFWLVMTPAAVLLTAATTAVIVRRGWTAEQIGQKLGIVACYGAFFPVVFWATCLSYPSYQQPVYPNPPSGGNDQHAAKRPSDNIYIFVFDEWSHRLTFAGDEPRPHLQHLRDFASKACVFSDAHSPGCHTLVSLPRLLFQRRDMFVLDNGVPGFLDGDDFEPATQLSNLFTRAKSEGYRTSVVGFHHPYPVLLGHSVDYAWSWTCWPAYRPTTCGTLRAIYWNWGRQLLGPVLAEPFGCGEGWIENTAHLQLTERAKQQALTILRNGPRTGQFAVLHLPFPHYPFIFHADGTLRDLRRQYPQDSPLLMRDHIANLDRVIGEFVAELKRLGKYENSVIVLTSDHNYRKDPDLPKTAEVMTHVPLLARFPGQEQRIVVDRRFSTLYLPDFIDYIKSGRLGLDRDLNHTMPRHWDYHVDDSEVMIERLRER